MPSSRQANGNMLRPKNFSGGNLTRLLSEPCVSGAILAELTRTFADLCEHKHPIVKGGLPMTLHIAIPDL